MKAQVASRFGYRVYEVEGGWRWTAFDACGEVRAEGKTPTRAVAAACLLRVRAERALRLDHGLDPAA